MKDSRGTERVWLLTGAILAALFFFDVGKMVFAGAATGLGMFIAIWVLFAYVPLAKRFLFSFGKVFDLGVSFGMPYVVTRVLGIQGTTMLVATLVCGLMFTFMLATNRLGGPARATSKSLKSAYLDLCREVTNRKRDQDGYCGPGPGSNTRGSLQCEEEAHRRLLGKGARARLLELRAPDYRVS